MAHGGTGKVALLDVAIHLQPLLVPFDQATQLPAGPQRPHDRLGAQLDQQRLITAAGTTGFCSPASQFLAAGVEYVIGLFPATRLFRVMFGQQPAGCGHASQFTVDLLMGRLPEIADRVIEPVGQFIAGGGLFQK